jgi:hypothetical protein
MSNFSSSNCRRGVLAIVRAEYDVKVVDSPPINDYFELVCLYLKVPLDPGTVLQELLVFIEALQLNLKFSQNKP